jgi:hypothetical protein
MGIFGREEPVSEHLDAIEDEIAELWLRVLDSVDGDEDAASTVMKAHADIALDSNMREKARLWLERTRVDKREGE